MFGQSAFLPCAVVSVGAPRYQRLLRAVLARVPEAVQPIETVTAVHLRKRATTRGYAGLTRYRYLDEERSGETERSSRKGRQTITFYTGLLDQLSDDAALAVVAHEVAHAWLNEHVEPKESVAREKEADELARRWGFGRELDALTEETV